MTVSIVGWYGTETMGDRAILDGILSVLAKLDEKCKVQIGSLYEFYTQRTLLEEKEVFYNTAPHIELSIFDIKDQSVRERYIKLSDLIILGGGPLMDLEELLLIKRSFICAKECNIPSVVMGCGIGPLHNPEYISIVYDILSLASKVSFRDTFSVEYATKLYGIQNVDMCLGDPAIISIEKYKQKSEMIRKNYMAVNFREYPQNEYKGTCNLTISDLQDLLFSLEEDDREIDLVPMHTFAIGGDDRHFLSKVIFGQKYRNVKIIHKPMNLYELYRLYANAYACIGMRYHSVVMQTILNGNNIIINYTDPNKGKIKGFIEDIDEENFYGERIINIQEKRNINISKYVNILKQEKRYTYQFTCMKDNYVKFLGKYFR